MAVVAVPFILYLVRFCSSKSCKSTRYCNGAFEKRALPVALEAYKLASDPRALRKKIVNA